MGILRFFKRLALPGRLLLARQDEANAASNPPIVTMASIGWPALRAPLTDTDRVLLSETHLWLRRIPRPFHPRRLCLHYPRAANRLARCWHQPDLIDGLLNDYLSDRRGGRVGFPAQIVEELSLLRRFHEQPREAWVYVTATLKRPQH